MKMNIKLNLKNNCSLNIINKDLSEFIITPKNVLWQIIARSKWNQINTTYNSSFTWASLWASLVRVVLLRLLDGVTGVGMLVLGLELENLFRAYTGLASARDVVPEEVSGPHAFSDNLLDLFLTTTQLYTDHSSQLGGRILYNGFFTSLLFT
jgi:hypothetical protein